MRQRLAIIRQSYRPDGGAERIIQRLIEGLQATSALDITLITQRWQGAADTVNVLKVPRQGWTRTSRFAAFVAQTQALLQQHTFDWVQSHERVPGCQIYRAGDGVHAEWLRLRAEHIGWLGRWWQARDSFHQLVLQTEAALFAHPALQAVICNAEQVRREIQQHYPQVTADKLHLVRNGIPLDYFTPPTVSERESARKQWGLRAKASVMVFVGSGFERKGLQLLMQVCARLPHWILLVVGQDKQINHYKQVCKQWGLSERVRFLGVLPDVRSVYRAADVLVHPAWYDPAPNVILEAMAMGLPIITSHHCGNQELISAGENGFVVSSTVAQPLWKLLREEHNWKNMGQAARHTVEAYPVERMLDELLSVYQFVLKQKVSVSTL